MDLGRTIANLRKTKNLNQREFANTLGVSNGAVAMWETNKRQPDLETLQKIADLFNVPTDYLLRVGVFKDWDLLLANKEEIIKQISIATERLSANILYGTDNITFAKLVYAFNVHITPREDGNGISIIDPIPTYTDNYFSSKADVLEEEILSLYRSQTEEEKENIKNLLTSYCALNKKDKTKVLGKCFDLEDSYPSVAADEPMRKAK